MESNQENVEANIQAVKEANQRFYDAFGALDTGLMEEAWEDSAEAMCVHPGWQPLVGSSLIQASWQGIFNNTTLMHFNLQYINVVVKDDCAWVTCVENISTVVDARASNFSGVVTNIFVRESPSQDWKMIGHHASPNIG